LVFLVLNVLASGIWDFANGRNNRIPLPGLRHFIGRNKRASSDMPSCAPADQRQL
jgi:hypothetical protein